jgi:CubicO group peptidase (beta-lactamase class C family)
MTTRHLFDRRQAILGVGAALMILSAKQAIASDGDFSARLAEMQRDGRASGLDALLVSRRDRLLFEYYGEGEAENWGAPLGKVKFGPTVLHDLRSVTKSLVGMLYGIALADGKVP